MKHKTWGKMTPEEKGALLLAHHEGKVIEYWSYLSDKWYVDTPRWAVDTPYRVKPEPKVETVILYDTQPYSAWLTSHSRADTHKITFDVVDGVPDCGSIKMEKL